MRNDISYFKRMKPTALASIRNATGLSQHKFAALVGCAPGTIAAVEVKKAKLPRGVAFSIASVTGCNPHALLFDPPQALNFRGDPYDAQSYKMWTEIALNEDEGEAIIRQILQQTEALLRASFQNSAGQITPGKFRALGVLFGAWLEERMESLSLGARCAAILREKFGTIITTKATFAQFRKVLGSNPVFKKLDDGSIPDKTLTELVTEKFPMWTEVMPFTTTDKGTSFNQKNEGVVEVHRLIIGKRSLPPITDHKIHATRIDATPRQAA
jgi:DNA-binding XRE family transcriptional regulator